MTEKEHCDCHDKGCECEEEQPSTEEIATFADDKIDALIGLLVKKGVITEEEMAESYKGLFEEDEEQTE